MVCGLLLAFHEKKKKIILFWMASGLLAVQIKFCAKFNAGLKQSKWKLEFVICRCENRGGFIFFL